MQLGDNFQVNGSKIYNAEELKKILMAYINEVGMNEGVSFIPKTGKIQNLSEYEMGVLRELEALSLKK